MRLQITATNAKQNGASIAVATGEGAGHSEAIEAGIVEVLSNPVFPPDMLQLWREATARGIDRVDIQDQMLTDYGIQFFAKPVADDAPPPPPPGMPPEIAARLAQRSSPIEHTPAPLPRPSLNTTGLSPRRMLQLKLKDLRGELILTERQYIDIKKARDILLSQIVECRDLLKKRPALASVKKKKVTHTEGAQ